MDDSYIFTKNNKQIYNINRTLDISNTKLALQYCSQYFTINNNNVHIYKKKYIFIQLSIISLLYFFLDNYLLINIYNIDTIYGIIVFILNYFINNNNIIYQPKLFIRYIYYSILIFLFYFINILTLFYFYFIFYFITYIFLSPFIIEYITHTNKFKIITKNIYDSIEDFIYFILSKQIVKIIIIISKTSFNYTPNIKKDEFKNYVKKLSIPNFINFTLSFIYVTILHYLERNGKTFYTIIFRQYYFKQIFIQDKSYIIDLMKNKNWVKLLDPYTLDVIINHYLKQNNNSSIIHKIKKIKKNLLFSFSKIIILWSFTSITKINGSGIIFDFVFIKINYSNIKKYIILYIFFLLSYNSNDQFIYLILYEFCKNLFTNKIFIDIIFDIYKYYFIH